MRESSREPAAERRIAALVLPELLCEIAAASAPERAQTAFGIVLVSPLEASAPAEPLRATARLDAVSVRAREFGVRPGQSIAEASALVAGFDVRRLEPALIENALATVAELALAFGATVALGYPDSVWVDVSGSAHLFGGEEAVAEELALRVRALGHAVRLAIASGPELARAVARWSPPRADGKAFHLVPRERVADAVRELPVVALPLGEECQSWLVRLGVLTLGDLAALPRSAVGSRLEGEVTRALELAAGRDPALLTAYQPPPRVVESVSFEHGVDGSEPLRFALRGLSARVAARLAGRGAAADALELRIEHDRSIAKLRNAPPETTLRFALAVPSSREEEIQRVVGSRLERTRLPAPAIALVLEAPVLVAAQARQLELGQVLSGGTDADQELPLVLAELAADVGEEKVGVLALLDAHRLEARSALVPALPRTKSVRRGIRRRKAQTRAALPIAVHVTGAPLAVVDGSAPGDPEVTRAPLTRLLPAPLELDATLRVGATLAVDRRLYSIEALSFEHRLHAIEWWTKAPVMRDYVRLWLRGGDGVIEALVYVDRVNGKRYLQAVAD